MWYTPSVRIALLVGDLYAPGVSLRQRRTVKAPYGDKHQKKVVRSFHGLYSWLSIFQYWSLFIHISHKKTKHIFRVLKYTACTY